MCGRLKQYHATYRATTALRFPSVLLIAFVFLAKRGTAGRPAIPLNVPFSVSSKFLRCVVFTTKSGHVSLVFLQGLADNVFGVGNRLTLFADLPRSPVIARC